MKESIPKSQLAPDKREKAGEHDSNGNLQRQLEVRGKQPSTQCIQRPTLPRELVSSMAEVQARCAGLWTLCLASIIHFLLVRHEYREIRHATPSIPDQSGQRFHFRAQGAVSACTYLDFASNPFWLSVCLYWPAVFTICARQDVSEIHRFYLEGRKISNED